MTAYTMALCKRWWRRGLVSVVVYASLAVIMTTGMPAKIVLRYMGVVAAFGIANLLCLSFAEGASHGRLTLLRVANLDGTRLVVCHLLFGAAATAGASLLLGVVSIPRIALSGVPVQASGRVLLWGVLLLALDSVPILALAAFLPGAVARAATNLLLIGTGFVAYAVVSDPATTAPPWSLVLLAVVVVGLGTPLLGFFFDRQRSSG